MRVVNQLKNEQRIKQQNFTSVNLIQVVKEAPDFKGLDLPQIQAKFEAKIMNVKLGIPYFLASCLQKIGIVFKGKLVSCLENPNYLAWTETYANLAKNDARWLKYKTSLSESLTPRPLDETCHSFYVATQAQAFQMYKLLKSLSPEADAALKEAFDRIVTRDHLLHPDNILRDRMIVTAGQKIASIETREIAKMANGQPIPHFRIKDLSELPEVFKQIDY